MDSKNAEQKLEEAFRTFRETPSRENREAFLNVADAYKEYWIEAQAAGRLPKQKNPKAPTRYKRLYSVQGKQQDGTQITLALQYRSLFDNAAFYAVSWRTRLGPEPNQHRINRRFYWSNDSVWTMDVSLALSMLEDLERMGGLDEKYFDRRAQPDSNFLSAETLEEVTMPHENWGKDPFLVVLKDPDEDWRKILIVNKATRQATFRSVAKSDAYKGPRKELRPDLQWYLDNSMQDVSVQLARIFLDELRRVVPDLRGT